VVVNTEINMDKIDTFLREFNQYKSIQKAQRTRGLNDFNIFTTLLNKSDEVRLHSRFLQFLLNPTADHYQGSLFLDIFLAECNLQRFFDSTEACTVHKEYRCIVLYITDGSKHIIIENKIYAGDQDKQIQRYIETIKEENKEDAFSDKLVVIYLSLDRKIPSKSSLGNFSVKNGFITRNDERYPFQALTYNTHILNWIESSQTQVSNITNLSVGLSQYKDVILKLYRKYEDKVMNLHEYIAQSKNSEELYATLKNISNEYQALRTNMMSQFFHLARKKLESKLESEDGWEVVLSDKKNALTSGKQYGFPLRIQQKNNPKVLFGFEFNKNDFKDPCWGIVRQSDNIDFTNLQIEVKEELATVANSLNKNSAWWLKWGYYFKGDLFDKIIEKNKIDNDATAVDSFVLEFITVFKSCKTTIEKCNTVLASQVEVSDSTHSTM